MSKLAESFIDEIEKTAAIFAPLIAAAKAALPSLARGVAANAATSTLANAAKGNKGSESAQVAADPDIDTSAPDPNGGGGTPKSS